MSQLPNFEELTLVVRRSKSKDIYNFINAFYGNNNGTMSIKETSNVYRFHSPKYKRDLFIPKSIAEQLGADSSADN